MRFQDTLTGYRLTQVTLVSVVAKRTPGRPKRANPSESPTIGYQWQATMERTAEYKAQCQQRHRRFILATNVIDEHAYPAERLLREYKSQQQVERGFRFTISQINPCQPAECRVICGSSRLFATAQLSRYELC